MTAWKGLILAGGKGSRLAPLTLAINKHLLPVFDKPMIYYPLSILMLAGIRDIVLVSNSASMPQFQTLLRDGSQWGLSITYSVQDEPVGIADGLRCASGELAGCNVMMVLGDNIFFGSGLPSILEHAMTHNSGATIFGYEVADPRAFGIVTLDSSGLPIGLEEKPLNPTSRLAVTGLYLYNSEVFTQIERLLPSERGELEVTDLNRLYMNSGKLAAFNLGRGIAWLDGGSVRDLYEAGQFVQVIQERTGLRVACPEEIAFRRGFINRQSFANLANRASGTDYGAYLNRVLEEQQMSS